MENVEYTVHSMEAVEDGWFVTGSLNKPVASGRIGGAAYAPTWWEAIMDSLNASLTCYKNKRRLMNRMGFWSKDPR